MNGYFLGGPGRIWWTQHSTGQDPDTRLYRNSQVDTINPELRDNIRENSRYIQDSRGEGMWSTENVSSKVRKSNKARMGQREDPTRQNVDDKHSK